MSNTPKKIPVEKRTTVSAKRLQAKGERVTVHYKSDVKEKIGLGFLLDGELYRSPGISHRAPVVRKEVTVIRDNGLAYDRNR